LQLRSRENKKDFLFFFFFRMGFFFFFFAVRLVCQPDLLSFTGQVSNCDITPDYGCPAGQYEIEDGKPNRLKCKDASRIMAWVTEPVAKPDWYTLFAGTDETKPVTTYTPGARVMINLRVKQYNQQYRGLLMYAHSSVSNVTKVGDWDFVDRTTMFHSWCPRSVLHSGAELKPYLTQWAFTAPPKGTGTITFRALLKIGVANEGEFYFPNVLTLTEAAGVAPSQTWFRAAVQGQSCDEVCAANCGMTCDAAQLAAIDTADKLETTVAPFVNCAKPYLVRCGREGVTSSDDGLCYYHGAAACTAVGLNLTASTCAFKPTVPDVGFRICPCTGAAACTQPPKTVPSTIPTTRRTVTTTAPTTTVAGQTTVAPVDRCLEGTSCAAGCKCDAPRVCEVGLSLVDGICLQTSCDPANPTTGCRCTDKCGVTIVAGAEEKLQCNNGFCTLVLRRTCDEHLGTPGCWCTEKRTCEEGYICSTKNNNCVIDEECKMGSKGCACNSENKCDSGLSCADVAMGRYCIVSGQADVITDGAVSLAVSALAALVAVAAFAL
jgi:hypothetical protein